MEMEGDGGFSPEKLACAIVIVETPNDVQRLPFRRGKESPDKGLSRLGFKFVVSLIEHFLR